HLGEAVSPARVVERRYERFGARARGDRFIARRGSHRIVVARNLPQRSQPYPKAAELLTGGLARHSEERVFRIRVLELRMLSKLLLEAAQVTQIAGALVCWEIPCQAPLPPALSEHEGGTATRDVLRELARR